MKTGIKLIGVLIILGSLSSCTLLVATGCMIQTGDKFCEPKQTKPADTKP